MGIFDAILDKISSATATPQAAPPTPAPTTDAAPTPAPAADAAPAAAQPAATIDVGAVLSEMAAMKGGGGNYKTSIVDLLSLLGLDTSLSARKQLADELDVHAGEPGTAEQNIALHKAVMAKLAANGGVVPDDMRG